jgi:hypothetical protein
VKCAAPLALSPTVTAIRDFETIDAELRLVFRAWRVARRLSGNSQSHVTHICWGTAVETAISGYF